MHCHHSGRHSIRAFGIIGMVIAGTIAAVVFSFIFGYFVQLLWNWLMPSIFGLVKISFWQGCGLVLLARLIFGSFGSHFGRGYYHERRHFHHHPGWRGDCGEKWRNKGSRDNWDYYGDWWGAEGKEAFENYIDKVKDGNVKGENSPGGGKEFQ